MSQRSYPPPFANDDPIRTMLAFNAEFQRIQELTKADPVRGKAELQQLLDQITNEKSVR